MGDNCLRLLERKIFDDFAMCGRTAYGTAWRSAGARTIVGLPMPTLLNRTSFTRVVLATLVLGFAPAAVTAETLSGQVVCSQCWFEADRNEVRYGTLSDLECAVECAQKGIKSALAVRGEEDFELYTLPEAPPEGGSWLDWTGRFVRAEGRIDVRKDKTTFRATSVETLDASPWPEPEHAKRDVELAWTDLRGRRTDLHGRRERIVVINFWATWCRPCIKEMPDLIKLHDKFAPYGVEFIAAAADEPEQAGAVVDYVRKHRINFPVVLGATTAQMQSLGLAPALPGTVVLDEHGHPAERFPGVIDPAELEATLSRMLGIAGSDAAAAPRETAQARPPSSHRHATHASLVPS